MILQSSTTQTHGYGHFSLNLSYVVFLYNILRDKATEIAWTTESDFDTSINLLSNCTYKK